MTSQLCNSSCFERLDTSNANADLKQPMVVVQDLESSSSSQEQQKTDIARQRVSILILVKSFCFGAFVGLLLQAVSFAAFLVFTKKWGKNPQPDESAPLSYWTLYLLIHADVAICALIFVGFVMTMTRKGSMYMRKKFDNDAHAPNGESVWTPLFLLVSGIYFLIGAVVGSCGAWAVVDVALGTPVPLASLLCSLLVNVGLCCLMIKRCFDWGHGPSFTADDEPEEDQEDSFFI